MSTIGPNFANELAAAGLLGLPFSWGTDGVIEYGESISAAQKTAIEAVLAAHNPAKPDPNAQLAAALAAGITIVSTATPALNGTYGVDDQSQRFISGTAASIAARSRLPGGAATFGYGDVTGARHNFSSADFLNFADAVEDYVYALYTALETALAGGTAVWPSSSVTIP